MQWTSALPKLNLRLMPPWLLKVSAELPLVAALVAEQAKIKDHEKQLVDHSFATYEFDKLPFIIETSGAWSVKAVALWKRIKSSHKAAVADDFATATFLNTTVWGKSPHGGAKCVMIIHLFGYLRQLSTPRFEYSSVAEGNAEGEAEGNSYCPRLPGPLVPALDAATHHCKQ